MTVPTTTQKTTAERSAAADLRATCPDCGRTFALTDALKADVRAELTDEYDEVRRKDRDAIEAAIRHDITVEIDDLHEQVRERDQQVKVFRAQELELRRRERALADRAAEVDIEVERRLGPARDQLQLKADERAEERFSLRLAEKDKELQRVRTSLEKTQRQATQGSQELQGTVQQDALEQTLADHFPEDELKQTPRGQRGADVLQTVRLRGMSRGAILWESKRAKDWNDAWIPKVKDDQRRCGAHTSVIVSACLPAGAERIDRRNDVWITDLASAAQLALVLRESLIALAQQQARIASKADLQGEVYDYITSSRFTEHVKGAVETMTLLRNQLDSERAAHERLWSKRAAEIDKAEAHIARMIGDIEGIGASIPVPNRLQLEPGT